MAYHLVPRYANRNCVLASWCCSGILDWFAAVVDCCMYLFREKPYYDNCFWNLTRVLMEWKVERTEWSRVPLPRSCMQSDRSHPNTERGWVSLHGPCCDAYRMTAGTAAGCWYRREGQRGAVTRRGGRPLPQHCLEKKLGFYWICQVWSREMNLEFIVLYFLIINILPVFIISHFVLFLPCIRL